MADIIWQIYILNYDIYLRWIYSVYVILFRNVIFINFRDSLSLLCRGLQNVSDTYVLLILIMLDDWHIISSLSYLLFLSYYQLMSLYFRSFLAIIYLLYYISINLAFRIFNSILLYILLIYDLGFAYFISTYLLYPQIFNFIMPGPSPSLSTYSNNHAEPARSHTRIRRGGRPRKYITEEEQEG